MAGAEVVGGTTVAGTTVGGAGDDGPGEDQPGAIALVDEDGLPVIRLTGEIDHQAVAAYDAARGAAEEHGSGAGGLQAGRPTVIDASGVTFLDCRGLGFLVRETRAARRAGVSPVLRRPTRIVRRVIDLAGARACFTITL